MKEGSIVKIINKGESYNLWQSMFLELNLNDTSHDIFLYDNKEIIKKRFIITKIFTHPFLQGEQCYLIVNDNMQFIFGIKGLQICEINQQINIL